MIYPDNRSQFIKRSVLRNKFFYIIACGVVVVAVGVYFATRFIASHVLGNEQSVQSASLDQVQSEWNKHEYKKVIELSDRVLADDPLSFFGLFYRGLSYFYDGISQPDFEDKAALLNKACIDLRKAMVIEPYRQNGDIFYILGKTYYNRGYFFQDLAKEYLLKAVQSGYRASDLSEYLGLVSSSLGDTKAAIEYFKQAISEDPRDMVLLSLANAYIAIDDFSTAMDYVVRIISNSKDSVTIQKARFVRGDLLIRQGKGDEAINEYLSILKDNPNSADAHFYLGEVYSSRGDTVKARAEWREAYNIDPKHSAAVSRLNS